MLARARALVEEGPVASLAALEGYLKSTDYDLGSYVELVAVADALGAALPRARDRLETLTAVLAPEELADLPPGTKLEQRSPYDWNGLYGSAELNLRAEPERCMRSRVLAASRAPRLLANLHAELFMYSRTAAIVGSGETLVALRKRLTGSTWLDGLARATLEAMAVEFEGAPPTTVALDQALEDCFEPLDHGAAAGGRPRRVDDHQHAQQRRRCQQDQIPFAKLHFSSPLR